MVEEPGGSTGAIEIKRLLGRLISTEESTATSQELQALRDYPANAIALVFADPAPEKCGWYRKEGAAGAGAWEQFETLGSGLIPQVRELVDEAKAARDQIVGTADLLRDSYFAKLYNRLWPEDFSSDGGEFVFVVGQIAHPGFGFLLPRVLTMRRGRQVMLAGNPIANPETAYRARHVFVTRTPGTAGVLWYDGRNNTVRFETHDGFIANLIDDPTGAYDKAYVLAVATADDQIVSPTGINWRRDNEALGRNQAPWGIDVTKVPYIYGEYDIVDVADQVLRAYGFTRGIAGKTNRTTYLGGRLPSTYRRGGSGFIRSYWEASEAGAFPDGDVGVNIWNGPQFESSGFIAFRPLKLETVLSPTARIYAGWIDFPPNQGIGSFSTGLGAPKTETARIICVGLQFCFEGMPRDIGRLDFNEQGVRTEFDATLPPALYLREGRPLDIFVGNALSNLDQMAGAVATIASRRGAASRPFLCSSSDGIELDPARMGESATINIQSRSDVYSWQSQNVAIVKGARTDAQVGLILTDSKGHPLASNLKAKYEAIAGVGKLTMIGTIPDMENASVSTEAHRGWGADDITHDNPQYPAVAANLRKPSYQQPTPDGKADSNVFIVPDDGSYPAGVVRNGYAFDLRRYLSDFEKPDPNFVVIELGVNQMGPQPDDAVLANSLNRNWQIIYSQCRAALPNARLIFTQFALGHPDFLDTENPLRWARFHKFLIRQHRQFVVGLNDPNAILVGSYLHANRRIDYPTTVISTDPYGLQTERSYNTLHAGPVNYSAEAEAILGAISV